MDIIKEYRQAASRRTKQKKQISNSDDSDVESSFASCIICT